MKWLLLAILWIMLYILTHYSKMHNRLLSCGYVMALFWVVMLSIFLLLDDHGIPYYGVLYVIVCLLAFYVGDSLGHRVFLRSQIGKPVVYDEVLLKRYVLIVGIILTLTYFKTFMDGGGFSSVILHARAHYNSTDEMSMADSALNQVKSLFLYSFAFLGGAFSSKIKKRTTKFLSLFVFLPSLIGMFTTSLKLGFITSIIFFVIGYVMAKKSDAEKIDFSFYLNLVKKYWKYVPVFVAVIIFSFMLRTGKSNNEYLLSLKDKFLNYAFGSPAAFNGWFFTRGDEDLSFGYWTFTSLFKLFGKSNRVMGVYTDLFSSGIWRTNVYSLFRAIILDFDVVGGVVFLFLFGFVAGVARKQYLTASSLMSGMICGMAYLFVFFSIFNSPFVYMNLTVTIPFSFFLNVFVLKAFQLPSVGIRSSDNKKNKQASKSEKTRAL